jgi:hypothetical protein
MTKKSWNGKLLVKQIDRCPFLGEIVQNAVNYHVMNDGWPQCVSKYGNSWVSYYEILKSGTMKIIVWQELITEAN